MSDNGVARDVAIDNPAIPVEHRAFVREALERERATIILETARMLVAEPGAMSGFEISTAHIGITGQHSETYLLVTKNWPAPSVRSLGRDH
jgi:hypothetical protein